MPFGATGVKRVGRMAASVLLSQSQGLTSRTENACPNNDAVGLVVL